MRALSLSAALLASAALAAPKSPRATAAVTTATAAAARPTKGAPAAPKSAGAGEVKYTTSTLAYLNRGSEDGLKVGTSLSFSRANRPIGTCTVDTLAEHWATCLAGPLRKGDTFAVTRKPAEEPPGPWIELPSELELAARHEAMLAHGVSLVDFEGNSSGLSAPHFSVAISDTLYNNFAAPGSFQVQRVDASVYDVELYKGLRASLDLSVLNFSQRPTSFRSEFTSTPVLLVRQVELGFRREDVPFSAAVGRIWTRSTPGLLVVDGAQGSYRFSENLELGLYGGLLPNETSLSFQTRTWTGGVFLMSRVSSGQGAESMMFQTEARLGYAVKDVLGGRFEAGVGAHLYSGKTFDGHLGVELGYGGTDMAVGGIDAARLDLGFRPSEKFRLLVGLRYRGGSPTGQVELGLVSPGQRALHGDLSASYELFPFLLLGVSGGAASDFDSALTQAHVGPEVTLPSLFGKVGGMMVGYTEEFGWMRARHGYVQLIFNLLSRVRLLTRTTYFREQDSGLVANELGETLNLDISIFRWLWVRGTVSGRTQLDPDIPQSTSRTSGLVSFQLGGGF